MTVNIGRTTDDNRKIGKTKQWIRSGVQCQVYDDCSIMKPILLLAYNEAYTLCNYIQIPDWSRFYWIRDIIAMPGNRCRIVCEEDVLDSNEADLLRLRVQVTRQEQGNYRNRLIVDKEFNPEIMSTLTNIVFPNARFNVDNGYNIVLGVIGGKNE